MHLIFVLELSETDLITPSETQTEIFLKEKVAVYPHLKP